METRMIPFIIGGVALAATGYGIMKYLEDDENREKVQDSLIRGYDNIDKIQEKGLELIDDLEKKTDELFDSKEDRLTKPFFVDLGEDDFKPQEDECLENYDIAKIELFNTTFIELTTALKEIDNLPEDIHIPDRLEFAQTIYPFSDVSDELKKDFNKHKEILQEAKKYIDSKLDVIDSIIISGDDFEEYSNEEKELIQRLIKTFKLIEHAVLSKTTNDGVSIAREVNRAFCKVEQLIGY